MVKLSNYHSVPKILEKEHPEKIYILGFEPSQTHSSFTSTHSLTMSLEQLIEMFIGICQFAAAWS